MKLEVANEIKCAMDNCGYECEVDETYSGRGMYGATTAALIVSDIGEIGDAIADNASWWVNDGRSLPKVAELRRDNMGWDYVVY